MYMYMCIYILIKCTSGNSCFLVRFLLSSGVFAHLAASGAKHKSRMEELRGPVWLPVWRCGFVGFRLYSDGLGCFRCSLSWCETEMRPVNFHGKPPMQ